MVPIFWLLSHAGTSLGDMDSSVPRALVLKPWAKDTVANSARADVWMKTACLSLAPSFLLQRIRAMGSFKATACTRDAISLLATTSDITETRGDPDRFSTRLDDRRIV